jgi:DNA-binding response OmpR family regulator
MQLTKAVPKETHETAVSRGEAFEIETDDLVVLDLMLPGLPSGGMDVCARIRDAQPRRPSSHAYSAGLNTKTSRGS